MEPPTAIFTVSLTGAESHFKVFIHHNITIGKTDITSLASMEFHWYATGVTEEKIKCYVFFSSKRINMALNILAPWRIEKMHYQRNSVVDPVQVQVRSD